MSVAAGITIEIFCKIIYYWVKRDHYEKNTGIKELLEIIALDCFNNPSTTDTRTPKKDTPIVDEVDYR